MNQDEKYEDSCMGQEKDLSQFTADEWGDLLIRVRKRVDMTQQEMAELLNSGFTTYQKWERGQCKPHPRSRRLIRDKFEETLYELGILQREGNLQSQMPSAESEQGDQKISASLVPVIGELPESSPNSENSMDIATSDFSEDPEVMKTFIASNISTHVWDLAYADHLTYNEKIDAILQATRKFDIMNSTNNNYQITRRDAFSSMATLPMITLRLQSPGSQVRPQQYGDALALCTAALEACWQLCRSSDASDVQRAFRCVSKYGSVLKAISKDSAPYRKEALDLATRYALLKTLLGGNCADTKGVISYAQEALDLSKATGNILLQLSAYTKLAWAYFFDRKYPEAFQTMQEGESVFQGYLHMKNMLPLPSCMIGGFNSTYAFVQANNGVSPDTALGIATDIEPANEIIAFMDFEFSTQLLEAAWTYCFKGDPIQAMIWLGKHIDLETLASRPDVPQSEHGRIEAINVLTRSLLQSEERDMGRIIHVWTAGMVGAKALKNEQRYRDAMENFEIMRILWPGEKAIIDLFPHTKHW